MRSPPARVYDHPAPGLARRGGIRLALRGTTPAEPGAHRGITGPDDRRRRSSAGRPVVVWRVVRRRVSGSARLFKGHQENRQHVAATIRPPNNATKSCRMKPRRPRATTLTLARTSLRVRHAMFFRVGGGNHLQQNARMAYVAYDALLSPGELRELLEAAVVPYARGKPVSLLDIASGASANAFVEHATPRGAGRVDIALTPAWARAAVRLRAFGKIASLVDVVTQERTNLRVGWHLMVVARGAQGCTPTPGKRFYPTLPSH